MVNIFSGALLTLADATATAAGSTDTMTALLTTVLPFAVLIVVFYFVLIRPQKKREKAENDMRKSVEVGDEVSTRGGIVGRVSNIKDDIITIETGANKVRINVQRWAIASKETKISD